MFVITGGGSGIGRALALALTQRGERVLIVGRREQCLVETASFSSLIHYVCADLSKLSERERLVEHLQESSHLKGLIHNAGTIQPIISLKNLQASAWQDCLATNLEAPLFLTQACLPMLSQGRVLHMGSGAAYFPVASWAPYCVSKAGLAMLTRCWQLESPEVYFASVMPGIIDTPMQGEIRESQAMAPDKHDFFVRLKQNHRLLTPETVATFLCWLLLDIPPAEYSSKEWDIYDKSHHPAWLSEPHVVPEL